MKNSDGNCKKMWKNLIESLNRFYLSKRLPWYIISLGILFRLYQYLYNRSLWYDEAKLALLNNRLTDFLEPVGQPHPPGFFVVEKVITMMFGNSEFSLRLFPLISGIVALFAFYYIIKRLLDYRIVPVALALFCWMYSLIYFSVEVKQYSSDVAIALILYALVFYLSERKFNVIGTTLLALVGAVLIWFSHPSVFILGGIGLTFLVSSLYKKEWTAFFRVFAVSFIWLLSFAVLYFLFLRHLTSDEFLQTYWSKHHFAPLIPTSISDLRWYTDNFLRIFQHKDLMNLANPALWAVIFLVGCISLFLKNKKGFFLLITPILLALIASGLHKYPFYGRLLLFIIPAIVILLSMGLWEIIEVTKTKPETSIIGILLVGSLFFSSFFAHENYLVKPILREEIKPVLAYIAEHKKEGDIIYVYYDAKDQFMYYAKRYDFDLNQCYADTMTQEYPVLFDFNIGSLLGHKRVWIIFSHVYSKNKWEVINRLYLPLMERYGKKLDFHEEIGSFVFLYDFSEKRE